VAADLRLRPCGHWGRPSNTSATKLTASLNNTVKYPWERENYGHGLYAFKYFHAKGRIQALWSLKLIQFWGPLYEKEYKITNTKLGTKVHIFRPFRGPWKGPVQVRDPNP